MVTSFSLPILRSKVHDMVNETRDLLSELPTPPTGEPASEILLRFTKFWNDFHDAVYAQNNKTLAQANRRCYAEFETAIRETRPNFKPYDYSGPVPTDDETSCMPPLYLKDVREVIEKSEVFSSLESVNIFLQLDRLGASWSYPF